LSQRRSAKPPLQLRELRPLQTEAGEVFAEAVGVVAGGFARAGGVEEGAAGVGEGPGVAADVEDALELQTVEEVELREMIWGEEA
jgi:hypothetical protein